MPALRPSAARPALALAALLVTAACGRDEITAPELLVEGQITVDASAGWAYLSLADQAVVAPADPLTSAEWDIGFNATNVMLNGGAAGPGGVTGHCLCQNSATQPTTEQLLALTAASELGDFTAVTAAQAPAASAFASDVLTPAFTSWHVGTGASATPAASAWLVRLRDASRYAKLRVAAIEGPTAATPGRVIFEYAVQSGTTGALGATRTLAVDVPASGGAVRVDLAGGATTTSATDWDLQLQGWTIRANGGVSGNGRAGVATSPTPFADITNAAVDARAYVADRYAGVFGTHPWYEYNLLGDHRVTPTFDVYLVRRGSRLYKVQLTDYYGPAGETRRITVRYEQLAG